MASVGQSSPAAIRIGIDARHFYHRQAGIYQYTRRLIDAFAEIGGDDCFTVVLSARDRATRTPESPNIRRHPVWTPSHNRLEQILLPLELLPARLDVFHSTDFIPPLRRTFKSVITVHDLGFLLFPDTITEESKRYYGQIYRAVESADGIIAVSESTKQDMIRLLGVDPERVKVIHSGVDPGFRLLENRREVEAYCREKGLPPDFVLFVGTIEPRKNLETLLGAWSLLRREARTECKLVIAGKKGWLYDRIFRLIEESDLSEQVVFYDPAGTEDLVALYNAARLFVFPSLYEGFGFPPLEAMACGLPVVCANTSSLPEIVGDAALLVEPTDTVALAGAIFKALTAGDLRRNMIQAGLRQSAKFDWRKTAEETLAVYHDTKH